MKREALPIDEVLPQIIANLKTSGALVLKAEPGAGKTTRVAAAMLDAGMAALPDKTPAQIILLQPRRVAARAAASRISEERNSELGQETGYQVRFEKRVSRNTRILVCTEGVFLRRLQDDPLLENVAAVIFDEFHERSIDSDLALALVRQVRAELRPDLKIVVMSATLNNESIAQYLGDCPSIECPGRMFPVDIEYLKFPSSEPIQKQAVNAARQLIEQEHGDILIFLPGVGEIRQTQSLLESENLGQELAIMQLYGDLPLEEQRKVLLHCEKQKIILATNVAETSLTIEGVTAVIDSGLARVNKLDAQLGLNSLQTVKISKASAEQRAGRAGRTQAGRCLRLWTEREQLSLRDFELPEIARVELSECLLQLLLWGESDLQAFNWFEHPPQAAYTQAIQLLEQLDAIENGKLSQLGKQMALMPLQPRLARLAIEGKRFKCLDRAVLCAALLSERDPIKRSPQLSPAKHQTYSDVLDRVSAIEDFAATGNRFSFAGELNTGAAKQILKAAEQLQSIFERASNAKDKSAGASKLDERESDEAVLKSIMAAFPDRICKRREANSRRARMVGGRGVRLADESAVMEGDLFVAVELLDTGQAESLVRQASYVDKDWLPQSHVSTSIEVVYDQSRQKVMAMKRHSFCDILLSESVAAIPPDIDPGQVLADALSSRFDLDSIIDEDTKQYLLRLECLREWLPHLELPDFGQEPWKELLPEWCMGCSSVDELRSRSLIPYIQSRLSQTQISAIDSQAPERVVLPSGRKVKLEYERGKQPILAARIQDFFGMRETPRIAESRVGVLLHLLAPNYRVQQITPDLASFWKNTYEDVRKELKGRYPKHAWPSDPLIPIPERFPSKER